MRPVSFHPVLMIFVVAQQGSRKMKVLKALRYPATLRSPCLMIKLRKKRRN